MPSTPTAAPPIPHEVTLSTPALHWVKAGIDWDKVFLEVKKDIGVITAPPTHNQKWQAFVSLVQALNPEHLEAWWSAAVKKEAKKIFENEVNDHPELWMRTLLLSFPQFLHQEAWSKKVLDKEIFLNQPCSLVDGVDFKNPGWACCLLHNAVAGYSEVHNRAKSFDSDLRTVFSVAPINASDHALAWKMALFVWSKHNASHVTSRKLKTFSALREAGLGLTWEKDDDINGISSVLDCVVDTGFAPVSPYMNRLSLSQFINDANIEVSADFYRKALDRDILQDDYSINFDESRVWCINRTLDAAIKKTKKEQSNVPLLSEAAFSHMLNKVYKHRKFIEDKAARIQLVKWMEEGVIETSDAVLQSEGMVVLGMEGEEWVLNRSAKKVRSEAEKEPAPSSGSAVLRRRFT